VLFRSDNIPSWKAIAAGQFRIAGGTATELAALFCQFWTGGSVDSTADPTARQKRSIGGIDNGVDVLLRDIATDDFDPLEHFLCPVD
jgi:hypothetical protein